jgi:hypothetical protein
MLLHLRLRRELLQRDNAASSVNADAPLQPPLRRSVPLRVPLIAYCLTMSAHVESMGPDPLADELRRQPALPHARKAGGVPGIQVIVCCLAIDFLLIMLTPVVGKLVNSDPVALGALYGIVAAQFAMAAIWLGVIATALYWMLAGLVLFCIAILTFLPARLPWPTLLIVAWGGLTFTLPFALVRMAGFRIEATIARQVAGEPIRFPLSRLFGWTFVIAAILGLGQALPAAFALTLATSLRFLAVAVIGLATLWAILWPGSMRHPRSLAPFALLAVFLLFGQRAYGLRGADTIGVATAGLLYILTLAGLLAIYRAAGWRLVATSGRGWLVR